MFRIISKRAFILGLIGIQLSIIVFLGIRILSNHNKTLGAVSVSPINKEAITYQESEKIKYYYEPQPGYWYDDESIPNASSYTINNDTLNERFDYKIEKQDDTIRIITLGDSFTYGQYVPTHTNWTELLEQSLAGVTCEKPLKFEVINLGVFGYDIQYANERFKTRGVKYNTDIVIWFLKMDDFIQINELIHEESQEIYDSLVESGQLDKFIKNRIYNPAWEGAVDAMLDTYSEQEIFQSNIIHFNNFLDMYDKTLILMTFRQSDRKLRDFLKQTARHNANIYYYEMVHDLYADPTLYYPNDRHPTVQGHRVIAEDIYSYLIDERIISCEN